MLRDEIALVKAIAREIAKEEIAKALEKILAPPEVKAEAPVTAKSSDEKRSKTKTH